MDNAGLDIRVLNQQDVFDLEPSLSFNGQDIIGGTFAPGDESGDAYKFCQEMTYYLQEMGVRFLYNTGIVRALTENNKTVGIQCVDLNDQNSYFVFDLECNAIVVCLGSYSYQFVKSNYKKSLDIYPAKGSSITVPIIDNLYSPVVSLTDDENKLVFSRLGNRLRVAGTAELTGWDSSVNVDRCKVVLEKSKLLFDKGCDWSQAEFWSGLRPTTPSNLPYVSKLKDTSNVYLNTGHGTLGWTLACGSAKRISKIINDEIR
jgi:D-amino-acid dehydrogenase